MLSDKTDLVINFVATFFVAFSLGLYLIPRQIKDVFGLKTWATPLKRRMLALMIVIALSSLPTMVYQR